VLLLNAFQCHTSASALLHQQTNKERQFSINSVMFEGVPVYPNPSRYWEIVDRHKVSIFYCAPTAIRTLMKFGDEPLKKSSRESIRLLGSVGEPINPEAWRWYYNSVGKARCSIIDTW
jgi:acetyl-CoA synthetase